MPQEAEEDQGDEERRYHRLNPQDSDGVYDKNPKQKELEKIVIIITIIIINRFV